MITKEILEKKLVGETVHVTATELDNKCTPDTGKCVAVHDVPDQPGHFGVELASGTRSFFMPETIGENFVEGRIWEDHRAIRTFRILQ